MKKPQRAPDGWERRYKSDTDELVVGVLVAVESLTAVVKSAVDAIKAMDTSPDPKSAEHLAGALVQLMADNREALARVTAEVRDGLSTFSPAPTPSEWTFHVQHERLDGDLRIKTVTATRGTVH